MLEKFIQERKWNMIERISLPGRNGEYFSVDDLHLSSATRRYLHKSFPGGIYLHQKKAIQSALDGKNICITTGTASGKSMPFYAAAIEKLAADSNARVIVVYPLKALGREQEERWIQALAKADISARVGRIDGQTPMPGRMKILRSVQVLIMTPDIIHAWLLSHIGDKDVMCFLFKTAYIIVDEIHYYTGVFGSNAAFLFRRLRHVLQLMQAVPQFITASATIAEPEKHLRHLFGLDFQIIDSGCDTSPRQAVNITLVEFPAGSALLTSLSELMDFIRKKTAHKFIAFVDSRKQAEYLSSIASRFQSKDTEDDDFISDNHLEKLNILPYRSGYEEHDRKLIQTRLGSGALSGIVSTSALELGLDIPYLTLGILVGVPQSATSFYQRIGRIGRHVQGEIIIINSGDIHSASIFRNPQQLLKMPLSEGALYLENSRVQYIHALCLGRHGGEHDRVCSFLGKKDNAGFSSEISWARGFVELCRAERVGEISPEFQAMKSQAGEDPHHTFPLRDVEIQFQVKHKRGPGEEACGSLSYSQLMNEAYPGSVYYYTTKPYRVCQVNIHRRTVEVRREKKYTTKPQMIPTLVFPNLSAGNVFACKRFGHLIAVESALQIRESITGYKERRGPNELSCLYPLDRTGNIYFDFPRFTRNFFTTGVTFSHPAMKRPNVKNEVVAQILFEAFLMVSPLERRDIHFAADRYRVKRGVIEEGEKFIAIYDQTYGSLRLSSRILELQTIKGIPEKINFIVKLRCEEGSLEPHTATLEAMDDILSCFDHTPEVVSLDAESVMMDTMRHGVRIILPGSKGLNLMNNNNEFFVEDVFYSPHYKGLAYRGYNGIGQRDANLGLKTIVGLDALVEIPGESKMGLYNPENGETAAI